MYYIKGVRCRPTNRAPKRPQNSPTFCQIARYTGISVFWHLWALRTSPARPGRTGEAADLSIMASWPGLVEPTVIFFELLPTMHHAKLISTCSPRPKQHPHGVSSYGKRRMRGQSPRKGKVPKYCGHRLYIDNPYCRRSCLARGKTGREYCAKRGGSKGSTYCLLFFTSATSMLQVLVSN
jgi:hypothetical protein